MVEYTLYILLDGTMKHFGPFYFRVWAHFWLKGICFELGTPSKKKPGIISDIVQISLDPYPP